MSENHGALSAAMDMDSNFTVGKPPATAGVMDLKQMPDTPHRGSHHRRALSDTSFRLPNLDDLIFDPSDLDLSYLPSPSPSPSSGASISKFDDSSGPKVLPSGSGAVGAHFRSLSMDSDFFDSLGISGDGDRFDGKLVVGEKRVVRHRHSNSMDGSSSSVFEADCMVVDGVKKAMGADKLAELSLIDPKRAKRILANRQSAARSKERKVRYTSELERKVQTLQSEATTLSAQVTILQRDTTGLSTENKELKLRLQALEQQAQLRDALNEALKEEVQRLKIAAGQMLAGNGNSYNRGLPLQFPSPPPSLHQFGTSKPQIHMPHTSANQQHRDLGLNGHQSHPGFMDFNPNAG